MKSNTQANPRVLLNISTRDETIANLQLLRLPGMLAAYSRQFGDPAVETMGFDDRLSIIVKEEVAQRTIRRRQRLLKESRIREGDPANLEEMIYSEERGLSKQTVDVLASCNWITCEKPKTLLVWGAAGTGKSWLIKALGKRACYNHLPTLYYRYVDLKEKLEEQHEKHSVAYFIDRVLCKKKLLIIDDFAMGESPSQAMSSDLLSIIDARYQREATIVASQRPWTYWHDWINDSATADALMDRLTSLCIKVEHKGRSLRELNRD